MRYEIRKPAQMTAVEIKYVSNGNWFVHASNHPDRDSMFRKVKIDNEHIGGYYVMRYGLHCVETMQPDALVYDLGPDKDKAARRFQQSDDEPKTFGEVPPGHCLQYGEKAYCKFNGRGYSIGTGDSLLIGSKAPITYLGEFVRVDDEPEVECSACYVNAKGELVWTDENGKRLRLRIPDRYVWGGNFSSPTKGAMFQNNTAGGVSCADSKVFDKRPILHFAHDHNLNTWATCAGVVWWWWKGGESRFKCLEFGQCWDGRVDENGEPILTDNPNTEAVK